jgi:hypothetical protein
MKNIEYREDYLFIEYDEAVNSPALISLMKEIVQICQIKNYKKVLADLSRTRGILNLSQRYELGVIGADMLRGLKIAVVYHPDENNQFAESVAVNRGLPAIITDNIEEAKRWLGVE